MVFTEDLLAALPGKSRSKIERLEADREAAHAAYRAASDREQEARQELGQAEARARDQAAKGPGYGLEGSRFGQARQAEQQALEERLQAPVEAARRRVQSASDARERAAESFEQFSYLEECSAWLARALQGGVEFKHYLPKPAKVKDARAEIDQLRKEIAALDRSWRETENAPVPAEELKARTLQELDAIAERGAPRVNARARAGSPVGLADSLAIGLTPRGDSQSLVGDAGAHFFVWLMRDQIAERLTAMIDQAAPENGILSDQEREKHFAELAQKRLELERQEEALICLASRSEVIVPRRRLADPRAVLEITET